MTLDEVVSQKDAIDLFLNSVVCGCSGLISERDYEEYKLLYFYQDEYNVKPIRLFSMVTVYALSALLKNGVCMDISVFKRLVNDGFSPSEYCYAFIAMRYDISLQEKKRLFYLLETTGTCMSHTIYAEIARCHMSPSIREIFRFFFGWENANTNVPLMGLSRDGVIGSSFYNQGEKYIPDLQNLGFPLDPISIDMILNFRTPESSEGVKMALSHASESLKCQRYQMILISTLDFYSISQGIEYSTPNFYLATELYKMGIKPPENMWDVICPFRMSYKSITRNLIDLALWYLDTVFEEDENILINYWDRKLIDCVPYGKDHMDYAKEIETHPRLEKSRAWVIQRDKEEYTRVYKMTPEEAASDVIKAQARGVCLYWKVHRCSLIPSNHVHRGNHFGFNYQGSCSFYHGRDENTYKMKIRTSTVDGGVRNRVTKVFDPTASVYYTGTRDKHMSRSARHYINSCFIPLRIEKEVAEIMNGCWCFQYEPRYLPSDGSDSEDQGFKLVPAKCPVTGETKNLRFMVKKSLWAVYYYTIEALESCEGTLCPYYLQEPEGLVYQ